jgi:ferric iron reductase protein FhuF
MHATAPDSTPFDLDALLSGPLALLRGNLRFGAPQAEPGQTLVRADRLAERADMLIAAMRGVVPGDDARALLSLWSKRYWNIALRPAVVLALLGPRPLRMPLAECMVALQDGLPQALWLPLDAVRPPAEHAATRYQSLCVEHLAPLIQALSATVRLAPRVLWNNAGNQIEALLANAHQWSDAGARAQHDARFLFASAGWFGSAQANPLRQPVRYVATASPHLPNPLRMRRVCCLRYRLPDEAPCSSCPLLLTMSEAELQAQARRALARSAAP